jgi:hypothetical protein
MLEFLLLILTLVAIVATILLFVIANKLTDGRCWEVTKAIGRWAFRFFGAFLLVAGIAGLMEHNWDKIQTTLLPLGIDIGIVVVLLLGAWALFEAVRHAIVRPFLKGLRGR